MNHLMRRGGEAITVELHRDPVSSTELCLASSISTELHWAPPSFTLLCGALLSSTEICPAPPSSIEIHWAPLSCSKLSRNVSSFAKLSRVVTLFIPRRALETNRVINQVWQIDRLFHRSEPLWILIFLILWYIFLDIFYSFNTIMISDVIYMLFRTTTYTTKLQDFPIILFESGILHRSP